MPPIKLPYNKSEDPWHAAQAFLHRHNLPQDYLDTVANYIIKNAGLSQSDLPSTSGGGGFSDPFTGGGRYVPGAGSPNQRQRTRLDGSADRFPVRDYNVLVAASIQLVMSKFRTPPPPS